MQTLKFNYHETEISFTYGSEENVMVNATEMAKAFGKRIDVFLKTDHAKSFINALELTPFGGSSEPLKRDEIIKSISGASTWMHRILALKFAAWLDPKFEVWVFSTIDEIILGAYRQHKQASIAKIKAQKALEDKKKRLLEENPEFQEFLDLEKEVNEAARQQKNALRMSNEQLKMDFSESETKYTSLKRKLFGDDIA